jgi:hypothetical protein
MQDAIGNESTPVPITQAHQFYGLRVTNPSAPPPPRRAGDRLLYLALTLFAIGLLAIVAIFLTPVLSDSSPGLWLYLTAMLAPVGFLIGIVYALWSGRRSR